MTTQIRIHWGICIFPLLVACITGSVGGMVSVTSFEIETTGGEEQAENANSIIKDIAINL